uniref:WGS project CAEQ00000000 data, annotated contig 1334 n=1 Tax=Trypanosoma congolense (strain IL3000) TaxID=1068625 RepID=F9W5J8_TRYCI|nr:unnamed protein product [Trypanosoma congolense IL3000]
MEACTIITCGNRGTQETTGVWSLDPALLNVVPPPRFAIVEEGVYRGAYPTLRNFPFLRSLNLRTIVSLTPEEPTFDLSRFAIAEGITIRYVKVEQNKGEAQLLPTNMSEILQMLVDAEQHPLYLHCLDGRYTTGLVVMGLRKLQHWSVSCSHMEYQRFARCVQDEVAFIADYGGPVVIPKKIPSWLWNGSWCDSSGKPKRLHTGIRLKFPSTLRDGVVSTEQVSHPVAAVEIDAPASLHGSPTAEGCGAAYVDIENIEPVQPVHVGNSRVSTFAIQVKKRPAVDMRSLALRVSAGACEGKHCCTDVRCSGNMHHNHDSNGRMGAASGVQPSGGVVTGEQAAPRCGVAQQASALELPGGAGDGPHALQHAPKHVARARCGIQLLAAEGEEGSTPAGEVSSNSKRTRRRKSI